MQPGQQEIQKKGADLAKLIEQLVTKQKDQAKLTAEIKDLSAKVQKALAELSTIDIGTASAKKEDEPAPVPDDKPAPKPKAKPKPPPEGEPKPVPDDKPAPKAEPKPNVIPEGLVAEEGTWLTFNWPSAYRKYKDGDLRHSSISQLDEATELILCLQQALDDHCKAAKPPSGYKAYLAPKIKKVEKFQPWPTNPNANASVRVFFDTVEDAQRLFDTYDALSKKYLTMQMDGDDPKRKETERIYIRPLRRDDASDTMSVAPSITSDSGQRSMLLADGIDLDTWRSKADKWFPYKDVQKSVLTIAKDLELNAPETSFGVAPEGRLCLTFSTYTQAKLFMEKEKEHPLGLMCGGKRLGLNWAKDPQGPRSRAKAKS